MDIKSRINALIAGLLPAKHAGEIARLRAARSLPDLEALAREGWLTPEGSASRVRLVRHGSGTLLLVEYTDGWTKTLSKA